MKYNELKDYINANKLNDSLKRIICADDVENEKQRYISLLDKAYELYGDGDYHFISSPGRSEIGGNHTDHQHGNVVACSLNIDNLCVVKANDNNVANFKDLAFDIKPVDLNNLAVVESEKNTSESLIRGVAYRLADLGYKVGGFDALCESKVLVGSGISSSACFEVMLVEIFNSLYNDDKVNAVDRAVIGQYAENNYFGKPCGLLDQMAISVGGFVTIDFKNPTEPKIDSYEFSFADYGYELVLVNTKGDHSDLSHEYAAVTVEIKEVAKCLGVDYLADSDLNTLLANLKKIRETVKNDRGILRSINFYNEDNRAKLEKQAIKDKDINALLKLMKESGRGSFEYLQNVYPASRPASQSLPVGLILADMFLKDDGAYRVHGGGFEGTIQVIVPSNRLKEFANVMEPVFGDDCLLCVRVRPMGTCTVI